MLMSDMEKSPVLPVTKKRKKFEKSLKEREEERKKKKIEEHGVKSPCEEGVCKRMCTKKIPENQRIILNNQSWALNDLERKNFLFHHVLTNPVERRRVDPSNDNFRKQKTHYYVLNDGNNVSQMVCKTFFLTTLGFNKGNDKVLRNLEKVSNNLIAPPKHALTKKPPSNKIDETLIREHILKFEPKNSHYRREHAPNRLYLPSDLSFSAMHQDFLEKNPNFKCGYEKYRSVAKSMNISIVQLGNEECEVCEEFKLHSPLCRQNDCSICKDFNLHKEKARKARELYKKNAEDENPHTVFYSADLEKVIMLPRLDCFKSAIFCHRLSLYNESFVPLGKSAVKAKTTYAILWHDALAGRSKDEIISAFYYFLKCNEDMKTIVIWLDNCSAQNKNWSLFSFILYYVNLESVNTEKVIVRYFEPGHTFMSADSFHHRVELSMKKSGNKIYDFSDFVTVVKSAGENVVAKELEVGDFFNAKDYSSQYILNKIIPRPYLKDMVEVTFQKNKKTVLYKENFDQEDVELNFLNNNYKKKNLDPPQKMEFVKGINPDRKKEILKVLGPLMPPEKREFWQNLSENSSKSEPKRKFST